MQHAIIIPGLGSPGWSMSLLALRLRRQGTSTRIFPYSAFSRSLGEVVSAVKRDVEAAGSPQRVHLVGHSMGGLVALGIATQGLDNIEIGRLVMIGTPLRGSAIAARISALPVRHLPYGRVWTDISPEGCQGNESHRHLGQTGMIAGAVPGGRWIGASQSDGVVPVSATMAEGLKDHVTVPASHALLLASKRVARLSAEFIATGRFSHPQVSRTNPCQHSRMETFR
ncbi:alpha/beta fold hydrolase [Agrobacterium rubi]|nr:alpha/beta fold hydrolase [Agrobacterium rubi]NTF24906.1 alpha/beta fold hydrolase [Agrobacterium rubi]